MGHPSSTPKIKRWETNAPGKRGKRSDGGFLSSLQADRASAKIADDARKPKK